MRPADRNAGNGELPYGDGNGRQNGDLMSTGVIGSPFFFWGGGGGEKKKKKKKKKAGSMHG